MAEQSLDFLGVGTALDRVQNLLGKGFLLAGFFPMFVFFCVNLLLGYWIFPAERYLTDRFLQLKPIEQVPYFIGLVLLIGFSGFVFWSLNPLLREVLEGRQLLASRIGSFLAAFQQSRREQLEGRLEAVMHEVYGFRKLDIGKALRDAREVGDKKIGGELILSDALKKAYKKLRFMRWYKPYIPYSEMRGLFLNLQNELSSKPANQLPELNKMQRDFRVLYSYVWSMAERNYSQLDYAKRTRFPEMPTPLRPTRMGNIAELPRQYGKSRYGIDIDIFWPRLQKIIQADNKFYPILEEAKTQLDFAVAMTWVMALFTLLWSPIILLMGSNFLQFLVVFGAGVPISWFFYSVSVRSYRAFGEALCSAIDLFRFDLLHLLHLHLPMESNKERELWEKLTDQAKLQDKTYMPYKHEGVISKFLSHLDSSR